MGFSSLCGTAWGTMFPLTWPPLCKCSIRRAAEADHAMVCEKVAKTTQMRHDNLANALRLVASACSCQSAAEPRYRALAGKKGMVECQRRGDIVAFREGVLYGDSDRGTAKQVKQYQALGNNKKVPQNFRQPTPPTDLFQAAFRGRASGFPRAMVSPFRSYATTPLCTFSFASI